MWYFFFFFKVHDLTRRNIPAVFVDFSSLCTDFYPFCKLYTAATRLMARAGETHLYAFNSIRRNIFKII